MIKKPLVIILNGYAGSGKDTMIKLISKNVDKCLTVSSIDTIKDVCYLLGWDGIKTPQGRKMLSDMKDLSVWYNDLPMKICKEFYENNVDADVIVFQIREPKEIQKALKTFDNSVSVLLSREYDADKPYLSDDVWSYGDKKENEFDSNEETILGLMKFDVNNPMNEVFRNNIFDIVYNYKANMYYESQAKNSDVMKTKYDYVIENNGTLDELEDKLKNILWES